MMEMKEEEKLVMSQFHLHISLKKNLIRLAREIRFLFSCFCHASAAFEIKRKNLNKTGLFSYICSLLMAHLMQDVGFPTNDGSFIYSKLWARSSHFSSKVTGWLFEHRHCTADTSTKNQIFCLMPSNSIYFT